MVCHSLPPRCVETPQPGCAESVGNFIAAQGVVLNKGIRDGVRANQGAHKGLGDKPLLAGDYPKCGGSSRQSYAKKVGVEAKPQNLININTRLPYPKIFLESVGIDQVSVEGSAESRAVPKYGEENALGTYVAHPPSTIHDNMNSDERVFIPQDAKSDWYPQFGVDKEHIGPAHNVFDNMPHGTSEGKFKVKAVASSWANIVASNSNPRIFPGSSSLIFIWNFGMTNALEVARAMVSTAIELEAEVKCAKEEHGTLESPRMVVLEARIQCLKGISPVRISQFASTL
ncbi:hypothetical protein U1Q18_003406 [Sarracenia purpurea var. burkii]